MERKYALLIYLGLGIGALYGMFFGPALENPALGVAFGALAGVAVGWFIAAYLQRRDTGDKTDRT
jgi:hypothetical protein